MRTRYPCREDDEHPEPEEEAGSLGPGSVEEKSEKGGTYEFENEYPD